MKKLLSFLTAGALALGLVGCSGDLHDKTVSPLYIEGDAWSPRTTLEVVDDTTQKVSFTYTGQNAWGSPSNTIQFKVITTATGWDDDFGGAEDTPVTLEVNADYMALHSRKNEGIGGGGPGNITLSGLDLDTEYTIWIEYALSSNEAKVKYEGPDPIPVVDYSVISGATITKMDMLAKNQSYQATFKGDGDKYEFSLYDGNETYGVATAGADVTSAPKALVKGGKAISVNTLNGVEYLISVEVSDDGSTVLVQPSLLCYKAGLASLNSNYGNYDLTWTVAKDGSSASAVVTIKAGTENGWGGAANADVEFGVAKDTSWTGKYTGAVITGIFTPFELTSDAKDNNKVVSLFDVSKEDVIITLVSTEKTITASVMSSSVDKEALCFKEPLLSLNSNYGNYPLCWTAGDTAGSYKAVVTIKAGTENGWGGAADANVEFGVCNDKDWGIKYTGGTLSAADTAVALKKGDGANNKAAVNPSVKDVVITIVADKTNVTASYKQ